MQIPSLSFDSLSSINTDHSFKRFLRSPRSPLALVGAVVLFGIAVVIITSFASGMVITLLINFGVVGLILTVFYTIMIKHQHQKKEREAMLAFAADNNLDIQIDNTSINHTGMLFGIGEKRVIKQAITIPVTNSWIEIGNYSYVIPGSKHDKTVTIGYMHTKLPRRLPHIILDAKANDKLGINAFATRLDRKQILSLEGDFDKHFTLYAPKQYERDALYILTPDVMHTLITHARDFDVEIIDDDIYLYGSRPFDLAYAETWKHLLSVISTVNPEFTSQTDYYADERVYSRSANMVAPSGQRLARQGIGLAGVIVVVLVSAFQIVPAALDAYAARGAVDGGLLFGTIMSIVGCSFVVVALILKYKNKK